MWAETWSPSLTESEAGTDQAHQWCDWKGLFLQPHTRCAAPEHRKVTLKQSHVSSCTEQAPLPPRPPASCPHYSQAPCSLLTQKCSEIQDCSLSVYFFKGLRTIAQAKVPCDLRTSTAMARNLMLSSWGYCGLLYDTSPGYRRNPCCPNSAPQ